MDRNKKNKGSHPASIDGFVSDGRALGAPVTKSYRPEASKSSPGLGSYVNKPDGFHPIRQAPRDVSHTPEAAETEALLDEPIVLADEAGHKRRKPKHAKKESKRRRRLKRAGLILASLFIIFGAYFAVKIYITQRHLFHGGGGAPALAQNVDINQLKGEGDGRINILLLGIGGPGHDGPDLTDTIILASIDPINHKAALLSIPRDLCIKEPCQSNQKINAAYALAKQASSAKTQSGQIQDGLKAIDKTLGTVLGVPIHYHAVVDFSAFKQSVDALGGVKLNVTSDELNYPYNSTIHTELYDPTIAWENHNNPVIAKEGVQTMNGQQALLFARSRETSSDFARGQRQRTVLVGIKEKALSAGTFTNPIKISSLLDSLGNNIYTDFSLSDMTRLQQIFSQIPSSAITSLDLVTPPHDFLTTGNADGVSIVEPKAGLFDYDDIQNYVHNALKDSFIAKENAQIAVYNATNVAGLATASANKLKSYGYNVTTIDNTPTVSNPSLTTIVDLSKGKDKYTNHYLEQRFSVTSVSKLPSGVNVTPPAGTSFVIILGKDASTSSQTSFAN